MKAIDNSARQGLLSLLVLLSALWLPKFSHADVCCVEWVVSSHGANPIIYMNCACLYPPGVGICTVMAGTIRKADMIAQASGCSFCPTGTSFCMQCGDTNIAYQYSHLTVACSCVPVPNQGPPCDLPPDPCTPPCWYNLPNTPDIDCDVPCCPFIPPF